MEATIIGLDIGGSKIAVVEGTGQGKILQRFEMPTQAEKSFHLIFPQIAQLIEKIIKISTTAKRHISAIGVSIGGPLKINEGMILDPPHLPGWHNLALKEFLEEHYPQWPVFIEHDGNAGALAEYYFGAGREFPDLQHMIFLTFGTGLGAGIILNGKILHGASDTAGEVGHWRLTETGPKGFGKAGSWEGWASGKGLVNIAQMKFPNRFGPHTTVREVIDVILTENAESKTIVQSASVRMGQGIALLVDALNPQLIVLGSLGTVLGDLILRPVREVCKKESLPQAFAACQIVPAKLGKKIGDVASLMAVISAKKRFF